MSEIETDDYPRVLMHKKSGKLAVLSIHKNKYFLLEFSLIRAILCPTNLDEFEDLGVL